MPLLEDTNYVSFFNVINLKTGGIIYELCNF